jgi:hypothetical protein
LLAGFWQNHASFRTLRVQLKVTKRYGEHWFAYLKKQAELQAEAVKEGGVAPEAKRERARAGESMAHALSDPYAQKPLPQIQDFWTDRARYQQRVPRPLTVSELDQGPEAAARLLLSWQLPDEPLTPQTLPSRYRNFRIISYLGALGVRVWDPSPSGKSEGFTGPAAAVGDQPFPPLGAPRTFGESGLLHVIDQFFRLPEDQLKVVGKEVTGGMVTYILEHATPAPGRSWLAMDPRHADRLRVVRTTRAWVAPELGYLPLRMEWSSHTELDGKRVDAGRPPPRGWKPTQALEEVQIVKVPEGGFYPIQGVIRAYMVDVNFRPPALSLEDVQAGRLLESIPYHLREETAWEALKIQANIPMPDEMFALPFPKDTVYLDSAEGKLYVTGSAQRVLDGAITGEAQPYKPQERVEAAPPAVKRRTGWRWGGIALLAAAVAWIVYLRVRAGRQGGPAA